MDRFWGMRTWLLLVGLVVFSLEKGFGNEMVEVTATIVPMDHTEVENLSQLALKRELMLARSRGAKNLLKLSGLVESGKWATIKKGREFWYPKTYSDAIVHRGAKDDAEYSVPIGKSTADKATLVIPNSPTEMAREDLGAFLRVRPTVKEGGLIYLEGEIRDSIFEGLTQEANPIEVKTKQIVKGSRDHEIMKSRIDQAVFYRFKKEFGEMLPYSAGKSENARRIREAQTTYDFLIPIELGNNVFGAQGKINLDSTPESEGGVIKSTVMKATMLKDRLVHRLVTKENPRKNAVLILEARKVKLPPPAKTSSSSHFSIRTRVIETEEAPEFKELVLSGENYESALDSVMNLKNFDAITSPPVKVKNGQSAVSLQQSREFTFPVRFATPTLDSPEWEKNYAKPEAFETRDLGISLSVVPTARVGEDRVSLKIKSTVYELEGLLNYGNPIMKVQSRVVKKVKASVENENRVEMPILPFRSTETEVVIPIGSAAVVTMIYDEYNEAIEKGRLIKIGQPKVTEMIRPRYLTVFVEVDSAE